MADLNVAARPPTSAGQKASRARQAHLASRDPTGWALDRIAELEARVAYLEGELGLSVEATEVDTLRRGLGVTEYQARFLLLLAAAKGRVLRPRQIVDALGSHGARIADASLVGRVVSNIRGRVGPGLFHCARGIGWAISPAGAARISQLLDGAPSARLAA